MWLARCIGGVLLLVTASTSANAAAERYSVDHMLQLEEFGRARFADGGNVLLFERFAPFEEQTDFSLSYLAGQTRSKLHRLDLREPGAPAPLFDQDAGDGYSLASVSPDGTTILYERVGDAGMSLGTVTIDGGILHDFELSTQSAPFHDLPWQSEHRIVFAALEPGQVSGNVSVMRESIDAVVEYWRHSRAGRVPTAIQVGSGRFAELSPSTGTLMLADASSGAVHRLAPGDFSTWLPSADGRLLAALRERRLRMEPAERLEHGANVGAISRELVIIEPGSGREVVPCRDCDVLMRSLNWASDGPLLAFVARAGDSSWSDAAYHVYDNRAGLARRVPLGELRPPGTAAAMRTTWLGDRLALLAREGDSDRSDWYVIEDDRRTNITESFAGNAPDLIAVGPAHFVILHEGEAWRLDAEGRRTNLTADVEARVRGWSQPGMWGRPSVYGIRPGPIVIVETIVEGASPDLLFIEISSGRMDRLEAPGDHCEWIAASIEARRGAVQCRDNGPTSLRVVDVGQRSRDVLQINEHLRGVVGGQPVRIEYEGPTGDDRTAWILLPPGYSPGMRVPTIVNVYPNRNRSETYSLWQLDDMQALNDHVLAGHGYAVLYPTIPNPAHQVPREPTATLLADVMAAVDAGVARGFVDPDRIAVQGHSFGGFMTGALIGLTDRFKTAVAQNGFFNLISNYGQFDVRRRSEDGDGISLFQASLAESGQLGLGAPPWEETELYLRNSPLMNVANVRTPILIMTSDLDYVSTTQSEEFFTALTRLGKDAEFVRYLGEEHVLNSPANIRDMWRRLLEWYEKTLGPPLRAN